MIYISYAVDNVRVFRFSLGRAPLLTPLTPDATK